MRWTREAVNPTTRWSLGCGWFHCQRETSDPAASPDDDSRMVSTPWGKDGKTKPLPSGPQHHSQSDGGGEKKNGSAQETPTYCFASFISPCVNSLVGYACATVLVLLLPRLTSLFSCFDRLFQNPIKAIHRFTVKQPLGQHKPDRMFHRKQINLPRSKIKQMGRTSAARILSGNSDGSSRVRPCVGDCR